MSRQKLSFLVCSLLLLTACERNSPQKEDQKPLFPLGIGYSWIYEDTSYNGSTPYIQTIQTRIQFSYTIDNITGFAFDKYIEGNPISLINNDKNGNLIETLFNNGQFVHNTILYKKNAKDGESWIYKSAVYTNDDYSQYEISEMKITCINTDTVISTPKGDFHCMAFRYHPGDKQENGEPNHTFIVFLSENVGKVKFLHYEHQSGKIKLFREQVLTDYFLE